MNEFETASRRLGEAFRELSHTAEILMGGLRAKIRDVFDPMIELDGIDILIPSRSGFRTERADALFDPAMGRMFRPGSRVLTSGSGRWTQALRAYRGNERGG